MSSATSTWAGTPSDASPVFLPGTPSADTSSAFQIWLEATGIELDDYTYGYEYRGIEVISIEMSSSADYNQLLFDVERAIRHSPTLMPDPRASSSRIYLQSISVVWAQNTQYNRDNSLETTITDTNWEAVREMLKRRATSFAPDIVRARFVDHPRTLRNFPNLSQWESPSTSPHRPTNFPHHDVSD